MVLLKIQTWRGTPVRNILLNLKWQGLLLSLPGVPASRSRGLRSKLTKSDHTRLFYLRGISERTPTHSLDALLLYSSVFFYVHSTACFFSTNCVPKQRFLRKTWITMWLHSVFPVNDYSEYKLKKNLFPYTVDDWTFHILHWKTLSQEPMYLEAQETCYRWNL